MFKSLLSLTRYKLSLSVAFSGLVGYIYYIHHIDLTALSVFLSVFFLSGGASALNQVQEKNYDAKMSRTLKRPIPMQLIKVNHAIIIAAVFILSGLIIIYSAGGIVCVITGTISIVWYNGLYTILKRFTAYAVFPGSFTGVFPICIGWYAAGGSLFDKHLLFISFFMLMWQIPHFFLLMLHYNDDYKKAGFPTFSDFMGALQIKRLILTWATCTVLASFTLIFFEIISPFVCQSVLIISGITMVIIFLREILNKNEMKYKILFISINSYMLLVMLLLAINFMFI